MENSKLPFRYWYMAMHLLTSSKKSFSAREFQQQIGHKRYEPIWAMLHKIRRIMGQQDSGKKPKGWVGFDEGFFEVQTSKEKSASLKCGRGSQRQAKILVMADLELVRELQNMLKPDVLDVSE
ncbi:MAG: IS1595 family transposase [Bacteroidota bacterium]